MTPTVLVVGAGMAGLTAARDLGAAGIRCIVVDKGRAVGGRMASRRVGGARFDHGAQHLIARSPAFGAALRGWEQAGAAVPWTRITTRADRGPELRYTGAGGMRAIPEHLAAGLDVRLGTELTSLTWSDGGVTAGVGGSPLVTADAVLLTPPVPQTLRLLGPAAARIGAGERRALAGISYEPCLAVLAVLAERPALDDGYSEPASGPVAWVADNQHKGVSAQPAVTIHSSPAFAAARLDEPPEAWVPDLCAAAASRLAAPIEAAVGHRWRYSMPRATLDTGCAAVGAAPVVVAGEAFAGARVEGAYLSGIAAAAAVADRIPG